MAKTDPAFIGATVLCLDAVINELSPPVEADGVVLAPGDRVLTPNTADLRDRIVWIVEVSRWRPLAAFVDSAELPLGLTVRVSAGTHHAGELWHTRGRPPLVARRSDLGWYRDLTDGGGSGTASVRVVYTTGELADDDSLVLLDATAGSFEFTMSSAAAVPGRRVRIGRVNSGANIPTLVAAPGETLQWQSSVDLLVKGEYFDGQADGDTNWL